MSIDSGVTTLTRPPKYLDYSLTGENSTKAIEKGLAEADWYQCPVPRAELRKLLERRDGPAIRDTLLWFALLGFTGWGTFVLWGTWLAVLPYMGYAVLYATASDSRWHEAGHGFRAAICAAISSGVPHAGGVYTGQCMERYFSRSVVNGSS